MYNMGREIPVMGDEFELSLELSIGGCYARSENKRQNGANPPSGGDVDICSEIPRSEIKTDVGALNSCGFPDLDTRSSSSGEIQASRRMEARMKRNEFKKSSRVEDREKIGARKATEKLNNNTSLFGETEVSEGMQQQAQFLLPLVNVFACPWVVPLRRGRNSGSEAPSPRKRSTSSLRRSKSQRGISHHLQLNNSLSIQQNTSKTTTTTTTSSKIMKISNGYDCSGGASATATATASDIHMPCVSTTGNGPNGKTITGLLYKYTNSEVSIMCVCHRTFFTPAEFVRHAGGLDVTHPLRHITVLPKLRQS